MSGFEWLAILGAACGGVALFVSAQAALWSGDRRLQPYPLLVCVLCGASLAALTVILNPVTARGLIADITSQVTAARAAPPVQQQSAGSTNESETDDLVQRRTASVSDTDIERLNAYLGGAKAPDPQRMSVAPTSATQPLLPDVDSMIAKLAERLKAEPGDVEGWRMLGWSYRHTDRPGRAAEAYARAAKLAPYRRDLSEALRDARAAAGRNGTAQSTGND